jgi:hypothetical protein
MTEFEIDFSAECREANAIAAALRPPKRPRVRKPRVCRVVKVRRVEVPCEPEDADWRLQGDGRMPHTYALAMLVRVEPIDVHKARELCGWSPAEFDAALQALLQKGAVKKMRQANQRAFWLCTGTRYA